MQTGEAVHVPATKGMEAWFEYTPSHKRAAELGLERIDDHDDPRWEGELKLPPFKAGCHGWLGVYHVARLDGEIVKKSCIKGHYCHANVAREFLRAYQKGVESGSETPWDTETFHRDLIQEATRAQREGRQEDRQQLLDIVSSLRDAMTGGLQQQEIKPASSKGEEAKK